MGQAVQRGCAEFALVSFQHKTQTNLFWPKSCSPVCLFQAELSRESLILLLQYTLMQKN